MKNTPATFSLVLCAIAGAALLAQSAHATDEKVITNAAGPASAASASTARRTLKFDTRHAVPGMLTLIDGAAPVSNGAKAQLRFDGQTERHACTFELPRLGDKVQPGTPGVVTVRCDTPWQLYDNGLGFTAFDGDHKIGTGTLRP